MLANASCLPSGDHEIELGANRTFVTRAVCPVSIQRTYTCGWPSRSEMYAMRPPSGDQRGDASRYAPVVSGRFSVPSLFMTHRFEQRLSVMISANWRA